MDLAKVCILTLLLLTILRRSDAFIISYLLGNAAKVVIGSILGLLTGGGLNKPSAPQPAPQPAPERPPPYAPVQPMPPLYGPSYYPYSGAGMLAMFSMMWQIMNSGLLKKPPSDNRDGAINHLPGRFPNPVTNRMILPFHSIHALSVSQKGLILTETLKQIYDKMKELESKVKGNGDDPNNSHGMQSTQQNIGGTQGKYDWNGVLSNQLNDISSAVSNLHTATKADREWERQREGIATFLRFMDIKFSRYQMYIRNKDKTNNRTLVNFVQKAVSPDSDSVQFQSDEMYRAVVPSTTRRQHRQAGGMQFSLSRGIFEQLVITFTKSQTMICEIRQSPQQFAYNLLMLLAIAETRALTILQFSWMLLTLYSKGTYKWEEQLSKVTYEKHMNGIGAAALRAMRRLKKEYWRCDPTSHKENITHLQLTNLCEEGEPSVRFFSLRPAVSDIQTNKIVTGLRLVLLQGVIHLQIQQGRAKPFGQVNSSSVSWMSVLPFATEYTTEGSDYMTLNSEERNIDLDDLWAPYGHVVTGVSFRRWAGHVNLKVLVTPIDIETAQLKAEKSYWISNDNMASDNEQARNQMPLEDPEDSTLNREPSRPDSKSNTYIEFSCYIKNNSSRTTVPFLDIQPISPIPHTWLTGVGLYHKGKSGYGGFVGLRVRTLDSTELIIDTEGKTVPVGNNMAAVPEYSFAETDNGASTAKPRTTTPS